MSISPRRSVCSGVQYNSICREDVTCGNEKFEVDVSFALLCSSVHLAASVNFVCVYVCVCVQLCVCVCVCTIVYECLPLAFPLRHDRRSLSRVSVGSLSLSQSLSLLLCFV